MLIPSKLLGLENRSFIIISQKEAVLFMGARPTNASFRAGI